MLTFEEFISIIKDEILEHLNTAYVEADVEVVDVKKSNDVVLKALTIRRKDNIMCPTIYLNPFFKEYEEGKGVDEIMEEIAKLREENEMKAPDLINDISDYEKIVDKILPRAAGNIAWNTELMQIRPYKLIQDIVFYFVLDVDLDGGSGSIYITNKLMNKWNVEREDLVRAAQRNFKKSEMFNSSLKSMFETLSELMPADLIEDQITDNLMYVLSNEKKMFGASLIWNTELLDDIYEKYGSFIIIPSSIHEVLIVPMSSEVDVKMLNDMVKSVNETQVDKKEWLSDHCYVYTYEGGLETWHEEYGDNS